MYNILVVEDEENLASALCKFLHFENYNTTHFRTFEETVENIEGKKYDVCLVDINLPDGTGNDLIDMLRANDESVGIIVISANNLVDDKIKSLDIGADDYLVKPFDLNELNARIRTVLRRKGSALKDVVKFNEIEINTLEHKIYIHGKEIALTKKEFELLLFFISNQKRVITKKSLVSHLWHDMIHYDNYDFIYAHVKNLRKKLTAAGGNDYINNIHSIGYKFADVSD